MTLESGTVSRATRLPLMELNSAEHKRITIQKKIIERMKLEALFALDFLTGLGETFDFGMSLLYHTYNIYG